MKYDLIIIGSGPAGYVAAIRAGQVGLRTAIIEKESIGGMCLNWGCIPSKAVIESAKLYNRILKDASDFGIDGIDNKKVSFDFNKATERANKIVGKLTNGIEFLLKKNGVEIIKGEAEITSEKTVTVNNRSLDAENIIISTGTYFPKIKSKEKNLVVELKDLFADRKLPKNIVVYGINSTAIEMAQFFALIGKKVTLVVPGKRIMPMADEYLANYMIKTLKKHKVNIIFETEIISTDKIYSDKKLHLKDQVVDCDMILNAQTRKAVVPKSKPTLELEDGFVRIDDNCMTSVDGIYAIGDVNGKSKFAHIASAQGLFVVNRLKGVTTELDLKKYPLNMYTVPEIAQIGRTEAELKEAKVDYKVSEFPLSANGKAMTEGTDEGFIRILSEVKYGEVLGVQIAAANATDLIAEATAFMQVESTVYDVAKTIHAHPTISEVFMEASQEAVDKAIHK
ncbi:MAG: dihydrolipoyl dehydrogenase [Bacteroidales bacterium]|nr:dihydrolipoyl dehydrogenase [Bacteroidales bacterium]